MAGTTEADSPRPGTSAIVRTGTWMYQGSVPIRVDIWRLDFDFWHHISELDGDDSYGDPARLGPDGHLYHARFSHQGEQPTAWPSTSTCETEAEAIAAAEAKLAGPVAWGPPLAN